MKLLRLILNFECINVFNVLVKKTMYLEYEQPLDEITHSERFRTDKKQSETQFLKFIYFFNLF